MAKIRTHFILFCHCPYKLAVIPSRGKQLKIRINERRPQTGRRSFFYTYRQDGRKDQLMMVFFVSLSKICTLLGSRVTLMVSPDFAVLVGETRAMISLPSQFKYR